MDYNSILVLGGLGFAVAFFLSLVHSALLKREDHLKKNVLGFLPGSNCRACGFENCETSAGSLGEKTTAVVFCAGGGNCADKYLYRGVKTCSAAARIFRGKKECIFGCIGYGDCVKSCVFKAISHDVGEVPVINKEICTGCGLCVSACPKKIISLVPSRYDVHVKCSSLNEGRHVREICSTGCISCGICVKICPTKAIKIENNLAVIDYAKCSNCGLCVDRCPQNTIERILPVV